MSETIAKNFYKDLSVEDVFFYLDYVDGNFYWKNPTSRRVIKILGDFNVHGNI